MEVHHPHHPTHKKDLKEYLTEFIMLFTAVTLGFFAENLREIYVEKERSHEFVSRFEVDLKNNIHFLDSLIKSDNDIEYLIDTAMIGLIQSTDSYDLTFFYDNVHSASPRFLSKNDTYEQMKSSGALRYIKDDKLLGMMVDYTSEAEAAEYRSMIQEAGFVQGDFSRILMKWMPKEIAVNAYLTNYDKQKSRVPSPDSLTTMLKKIDYLKESKPHLIHGDELAKFKDEILPSLSKRTTVMKTTMANLQRAKLKGEALLEYLHNMH